MSKFEELLHAVLNARVELYRLHSVESGNKYETAHNALTDYVRRLESGAESPVAFDLERAKKGEPFEVTLNGGWYEARFIGVSGNGDIVVERCIDDIVLRRGASGLRMNPIQLRTMYANFYARGDARYNGAIGLHATEKDAQDNAGVNCAHVAFPVKVPVA